MRSGWTIFLTVLAVGMPTSAPAQTEQVRFGNLHSHTSYSDGRGTPADAYAMACAQPGMDFFAITEHNHAAGDGKGDRHDGILIGTQPALYRGTPTSLVETADQMNQPGACVTIYGQEFSTISQGNHVNIFDVANVINVSNGAFNDLLTWLAANPDMGGAEPLLQFNHPGTGKKAVKDYGHDDFGGDENL